MRWGVALPSHEVLLLLPTAKRPLLENAFDFPFWFSFQNIRRWFDKIWAVLIGFFVRCEEGSMEDVMDFPGGREFEFVSNF